MTINIEGDVYSGVAQEFLDDLGMDVFGEQQGSASVPERRSWKRMSGSPARARKALKARCRREVLMGVPLVEVKTNASSSTENPALL